MDSFPPWPHSPIMHPLNPDSVDIQTDKQKKPRHRHSPLQLAALNELYEKDDHPPLDMRTSLAERLGMETKTVNAWFQNKRASSKKRTRGGVTYDLPPITSILSSSSSSSTNTPSHPDFDDFIEDDYSPSDNFPSRATSVTAQAQKSQEPPLSSFYKGNPEHSHWFDRTMPRRMRLRPTQNQIDELRNLFNINPHPSKEQREDLGERIGMRYQSITNWFQNQRSLAKKRKEDEEAPSRSEHHDNESRMFSAFPPPGGLPPPSSHPSLGLPSRVTRSPSASPTHGDAPSTSTFKSTPHRSSTPYSRALSSRARRTRPEPYQLNALRSLFRKTSTPSIEERTALALEIGMDIGKVTNWFRNLRQTSRKRTKRKDSGDDEYDDDFSTQNANSTTVSRSGSPSLPSSESSSTNEVEDTMDLDGEDYDMHDGRSDLGSEDDYQEAVTPPPEASPSLPPVPRVRVDAGVNIDHKSTSHSEFERDVAIRYSGVRVEDALLLLSFHQHIVH